MRAVRVLLPLLLLLSSPVRAETVDRVLWVVESQLVLASDVHLDRVLTSLDASPSAFWDLPRERADQRAVQAAMIRGLAGDVALYEPSEEEVRARVEAIRMRFRDRTAWQSFLAGWGLDEDSLATALRRRMVVERYLARNINADPSDTEAWAAAVHELLGEVRDRLRIREVAPRGLPSSP